MLNNYYQNVSRVVELLGRLNEDYKVFCCNFGLIQDWSEFNYEFSLYLVKRLVAITENVNEILELVRIVRQALEPASTTTGSSEACSPDPAYLKPIYTSILNNISLKKASLTPPPAKPKNPDQLGLVQFTNVFNQLILAGELLANILDICVENFTSNVIYSLTKNFLSIVLRCKASLIEMNNFYTLYRFVQEDGSVLVKLD